MISHMIEVENLRVWTEDFMKDFHEILVKDKVV